MRQIARPRVGQPLFGDIGVGLHGATVRQAMAAHFRDPAVTAAGLVADCPVGRGVRGN